MAVLHLHGKTGTEKPSDLEVEYLFKELELNTDAEKVIVDSADQMVQFFLTALTAILGAVLLVLQIKGDFLVRTLMVLLGSTAILAFGIFVFTRACVFRERLTLVRLKLFLIRRMLLDYGIRSVRLVLPVDTESPIGFSSHLVNFLTVFSAFCGLSASIAMVAGIATLLYLNGRPIFDSSITYWVLYALPALLGFLIVLGTLQFALKRYQLKSTQMLSTYAQPNNESREEEESGNTNI